MKNLFKKISVLKDALKHDDFVVVTYDRHPLLGDKSKDKANRVMFNHYGTSRFLAEFMLSVNETFLPEFVRKFDEPKKKLVRKVYRGRMARRKDDEAD